MTSNQVGIVGDWHGNDRWGVSVLRWMANRGVRTVYHAGDFGIWPGYEGESYLRQIIAACESFGITLWITPGNHEDYRQIEDPEGPTPKRQTIAHGNGWEVAILPRGYRWNYGGKWFLSMGGAPSIDYKMRRMGKSWWPEEMIRDSDLERLDGQEVDVMIAHDAPWGGTAKVQAILETPFEESGWPEEALAYCAVGREKMNIAIEKVDPRWFFHGHYHVADYRYDSVSDRHYVALDMDGIQNNAGILDLDNDDFYFVGDDSWVAV